MSTVLDASSLSIPNVILITLAWHFDGEISFNSFFVALLVLMLYILISMINNININKPVFNNVSRVFPFIYILAVIGLIMYTLLKNKKSIKENKISSRYTKYKNIVLLILTLLIAALHMLQIDTNIATILAITLFLNNYAFELFKTLQYYTTDG